jgi:DNA-binding response OmpR family regulator
MGRMRVLIAEDEARLAEALARGLRRAGCAVDVALDGAAALRRTAIVEYDAVVLDRDLPGVHGDDVCRRLAASERPPRILMLTAASDVEDRVEGLNLGADDYLGKPFAFAELVARLNALRRRSEHAIPPVLERGELRLDPARREVTRAGAHVALSPKEFGVLEALLRADGAVISAEELLERVWDEQIDPFTNTVRVTVMNLRRKLGSPALIETVVGAGYRLT